MKHAENNRIIVKKMALNITKFKSGQQGRGIFKKMEERLDRGNDQINEQ